MNFVAWGRLLRLSLLPTAIDLYDPWLLENLHYAPSMGLDPYRNDHASWVLQLSRGYFFLCSSEEQRLYFLGLLTALGRVNPENVARDPRLDRLLARVPFGVPDTLPEPQPLLAPRGPGEKRLLFGGLYDWYDPMTVLRALESCAEAGWRLIFVRHPNPEVTPQRLWERVETECRRLGWWGERVLAIDWVSRDRRFDLLREVDVLVALHRPGIETDLSFRTRFLDALVAGNDDLRATDGDVGIADRSDVPGVRRHFHVTVLTGVGPCTNGCAEKQNALKLWDTAALQRIRGRNGMVSAATQVKPVQHWVKSAVSTNPL